MPGDFPFERRPTGRPGPARQGARRDAKRLGLHGHPRLARVLLAVALLAASFCLGRATLAQSMPIENLSHFPQATLTVDAGGRLDRFQVWVADTPARQEQGLMFVRDLPAGQGMLFPMEPAKVAYFWMKNTYIPLDMLFVGTDGRIAKIIADAQPFSLANLSSDVAVEAVIEIRGGEAQRLGIKVGQKVSWRPDGPTSVP